MQPTGAPLYNLRAGETASLRCLGDGVVGLPCRTRCALCSCCCAQNNSFQSQPECKNCNSLLSGILSFLVTLAILYLDPFGLGAATDRYSKQLFYQLYAPFYDTKGQDHTSVVLVTDATAQAMGGEWPVSYTAHAVMLEAILEERPAALMIDILFLDQRDGLEDLKRVLRENKEKDNIPVYVAAPPAQLGLGASVLDDLAPDVVKFVSVEIPDFYHDSQVYPPFTIQYEKQDRFLLPLSLIHI